MGCSDKCRINLELFGLCLVGEVNVTKPVYEMQDKTNQVRARIAQDNPELANRFVARLAPKRLEVSVVKQILADAYDKGDAKKNPDSYNAQQAAKLALAGYLVTGTYDRSPWVSTGPVEIP